MAQQKIKPKKCPFCGAELEEKKLDLFGGNVTFCYIHPIADCVLSFFEVLPKEIHLWNRRKEE